MFIAVAQVPCVVVLLFCGRELAETGQHLKNVKCYLGFGRCYERFGL